MDTAIIDPPESGAIRVKGTVKWFDPVKGFGFIVSKDVSGDVLLHRTVVRRVRLHTTVLEGATVECDVIQKVKGLQARKLHQLDNGTASNGGTPNGGGNGSGGNGSNGGSPKRQRARVKFCCKNRQVRRSRPSASGSAAKGLRLRRRARAARKTSSSTWTCCGKLRYSRTAAEPARAGARRARAEGIDGDGNPFGARACGRSEPALSNDLARRVRSAAVRSVNR